MCSPPSLSGSLSASLLLSLLVLPAFPGAGHHTAAAVRAEAVRVEPLAGPLPQEERVDSLEAWMEGGRHWHAAREMRRKGWDRSGSPEQLLLLAEAEAGWGNWWGVPDLLLPLLGDGEGVGRAGVGERELDGEGLLLLARSLEALERWEEAEAVYTRVLELEGSPEGDGVPMGARVGRARVRGKEEAFAGALADVQAVEGRDPVVGSWLALEVAREAAASGAGERTLALLSSASLPEARGRGWSLPARALLVRGDSLGAEAAFWSVLASLSTPLDRAVAWERVGTLRLARGDSMGARGAFHRVLEVSPRGTEALSAARGLVELGFDSASVALAGARRLAGAGREAEAVEAYEVYEDLLGAPAPATVILERARAHLGAGEVPAALEMARPLADHPEEAVAVEALALSVEALRRLGRGGEVRAVQDRLVEEFPDSEEAVEILFLRADALQDRGEWEGALEGYRETAALAPARNLAGAARMRMGQLLLGLEREEEAAEVYLAYMEAFPSGRRWDQAAFWAGRILRDAGREEEGEDLLRELRQRYLLSYYAVRAAQELGESYDPSRMLASPPTDTLPFPPFLREGLERIRTLQDLGLREGVEWAVEDLTATTRERSGEVPGALLRLALELNALGFTREGINLGWELQRQGWPWEPNLLRAIYPLPFRYLVEAEARDQGLDPHLVAGLIRQESAFWAEARSRADARGLMQLLPSTARELARARGPDGFHADEHLYRPEVNLHLGMTFLVDLHRRFPGELPLVLSAYNAGPTRARRWQQFPEATDEDRFVERIPFSETRGYVKNVLRNRALYAWLYGGEGPLGHSGSPPHPP